MRKRTWTTEGRVMEGQQRPGGRRSRISVMEELKMDPLWRRMRKIEPSVPPLGEPQTTVTDRKRFSYVVVLKHYLFKRRATQLMVR